ncbi:MAG: EFR1 family ferrodoxin, partial [Deltaproteobacteria bacterium]|nr:EFR1 family ferrodoxin [Deltaproteobacteria bacterium]
MKTDLFYYTGTGNSLWTARALAQELGDADVIPLSRIPEGTVERRADRVGIVFPVHIWGVPHRVIAFLNALAKDPSRYYFAVAVNAGQVAATLLQLKKLMRAKGLSLSSGCESVRPS